MTASACPEPHVEGGQLDLVTQRVLLVCDAVGAFIEWWGFRAIHGRLWVLLSLSSRPRSQAELSALLGVSRSLVSTAIAELVDYRLVRPTSEHRHAPYQATMDVWSTIADVLREREWMILERVKVALQGATAALDQAQREARPTDFDDARVRLLLRMTELAQTFLRLVITLGAGPLPRSLGAWASKASALTHDLRSS